MEFLSGGETHNADEETTKEHKTCCLEQDKFASFGHFPDVSDFIEKIRNFCDIAMEFLSGEETYNADEEAIKEHKTYCLEQDILASFGHFS